MSFQEVVDIVLQKAGSLTGAEIFRLVLVSLLLAFLLYLTFDKKRKSTLVDLGHHRWIVK